MGDKKSKTEDNGKKAVTPFMGFPAMREEMERMMKQFFTDDWMTRMPRLAMLPDWSRVGSVQMPFTTMLDTLPKAELSETADEYELSVELPGLDEKEIEVTLTDNALVLKGEKHAEKESKEKEYHYSERSYGSIRRQFPLPSDVDREAMKATFNKGVLHVKLPKSAAAKGKPRRIQVTSA